MTKERKSGECRKLKGTSTGSRGEKKLVGPQVEKGEKREKRYSGLGEEKGTIGRRGGGTSSGQKTNLDIKKEGVEEMNVCFC